MMQAAAPGPPPGAVLPALADLVAGRPRPVQAGGAQLHHPDSGAPLRAAGSSSLATVHEAVAAAAELHDQQLWSRSPLYRRLEMLDELADRLAGLQHALAFADAVDSGVPISTTRLFAAALPDVVRAAAEHARQVAWAQELPTAAGIAHLPRLPWGPAAVLGPFNAPGFTAVKKTAFALAAGCPVLLKPSPLAPHAAQLLADATRGAAAACGAPDAVFQLLHGGVDVGAALAAHPAVRCLSFTGSRAGGRAVVAAAASDLKELQLECGSNNPAVVRADADVTATATALVAGFTKLNGQWCESPGSVFVAEALHDQLLQALLDQLKTLRPGPCLDPDTTFGPQANPQQRDAVTRAVEALRTRGASVHSSASAPQLPAGALYAPPVVVTGADPRDTVEEVFGPVLTLHPVPDDINALRLANSRAGGLAGYVFTRDVQAGLALGSALTAGEVKINGTSLLDLHPQSTQSFWSGSGTGGHGDADLLAFFLGTRIVGRDLPNALL